MTSLLALWDRLLSSPVLVSASSLDGALLLSRQVVLRSFSSFSGPRRSKSTTPKLHPRSPCRPRSLLRSCAGWLSSASKASLRTGDCTLGGIFGGAVLVAASVQATLWRCTCIPLCTCICTCLRLTPSSALYLYPSLFRSSFGV